MSDVTPPAPHEGTGTTAAVRSTHGGNRHGSRSSCSRCPVPVRRSRSGCWHRMRRSRPPPSHGCSCRMPTRRGNEASPLNTRSRWPLAPIREFIDGLPGGEGDFWRALRGLALELYTAAADPSARYFLDKTPRYHFILPELDLMFPDAKLIFLWRNPLAVVASICETWTKGRWTVDRWKGDLDGVIDLVDTYLGSQERAIAVNFEGSRRRPAGDLADPVRLPRPRLRPVRTHGLRRRRPAWDDGRSDGRARLPGTQHAAAGEVEASARQPVAEAMVPRLARSHRRGAARGHGVRPRRTARGARCAAVETSPAHLRRGPRPVLALGAATEAGRVQTDGAAGSLSSSTSGTCSGAPTDIAIANRPNSTAEREAPDRTGLNAIATKNALMPTRTARTRLARS